MADKDIFTTIHTSGLILMGLKHCGKSTLGSMLAETLALPFYDLDKLILKDISAEGYSSVRGLYRTAGRSKFQEYELSAAKKLADIMDRGPVAAALGGGTVENEEAMRLLSSRALLLYLRVDEEELFRRITASGLPPFLDGEKSPKELFTELYARRRILYEKTADAVLYLPVQPIEKNFRRLYSFITGTPEETDKIKEHG
ncbi:MAG: shikimate kinase [Spirochaetia bacterium]